MKETIPTYEELKKTVKDQELEIDRLLNQNHSLNNFEFFFKESLDLICIASTDAYFKEINSAFTKILGYSKKELLNTVFINYVHPEDIPKTYKEIIKLLTGKHTINFEIRFLKKNGDHIYLQWTAFKDPTGELIYAIGRDISGMKKTQEKLINSEALLNNAQKIAKIGSWEFNLVTKDLNWSNELYTIFEIENKPNPNLYQEYLTRFSEDDLEKLHNCINQSIIDKQPYNIEHRLVLPSNRIKWVYGTGIPILDNAGNVIGLRGVAQDITHKKQIYESIKAKEQAEAANKAKSDFLANMSHEIRTPLNGIVGFTDLLMKTNLSVNQLEYMRVVNESATTLMEIIKDILDFSKIESGKFELDIEEVDLIELAHQVIDLFKYQAHKKNLDLILNIDPNVHQYILADSTRLKQILVNLLSNAIKFTSFGQIRLDISQNPSLNEGFSDIKFSVKDTGIGIKKVNREKIFDSFMQADNSTTRKFGGTGLGLTISNQLLGLLKSELQLISKYGEGCNFFFNVEFEASNIKKYSNIEITNATKENKMTSATYQQQIKILVVEDNNINMLLAKTLLKSISPNCTIIEASDGKEAVEQFKKEKLDIILMDIQMPVKNGYEATADIRKINEGRNIPIIALTAGIMDGEKEKCLEFGMNDYISKPIIKADLEQVLLKWIEKE